MTVPLLRPHEELTHEEFTAISKAVREFESLWRQTRNPAIEPFLPDMADPLRLRLLIELIRIDQEHRWQRGEQRLLETYLQGWPELDSQSAAIQELLAAECLTRFCLDNSPTRGELNQRFPQFAEFIDLDRLRATAIAEKGEASTAQGGNEATLLTIKPVKDDDEVGDDVPNDDPSPTAGFPLNAEASAVLASRRIGLLTGKQFGRYEVRRLVGTGGMGAIYEARDTQLERIVALKIPRGELVSDPIILQRFLNEARAAGAIRHPNICPIYDVGKIDDQHFITMPLVQGMSLAAWMEHRIVSLREAAEVACKLASALQAIHAAGIRHRDIKASNVMIDERGEPLLMDFGLARLAQPDTHVTQSGSLVGTPAYMAPEQIQFGASGGDARSDVYSLGVLLYQMLTSRLPFEGPMTKVLVDIATKDPPLLETLRPDVDAELANACRKAMSREPSNRFQTAAEFESALQSWLDKRSRHAPRDEPNVSTPSTASTTHNSQSTATARSAPHAEREGYVEPPRRNRKATKLIAAAFLFVLAAVIVIKISDRAELVIKSPDSNVQVGVRQLAQPEQERTLAIGENSVRVRSGTVEVVLTGANADQYEVHGDRITLKRFGREVVEITRREIATAKTASRRGTGWHGWSVDAPPPAIAPFDVDQAKRHQEAWADYLNVPVEFTNAIGMKFRLIPPGEFLMGFTQAEIDEWLKQLDPGDKYSQQSTEYVKSMGPQHKVILTQPIYFGVHEVTQAQYDRVTGKNPSYFAKTGTNPELVNKVADLDTTNHPVENVSWNDAVEFCIKLSQSEKLKPFYFRSGETVTSLGGTGYRLPTEAEWEYACRAGTTTRYWIGDHDGDLAQAGWFGPNSDLRTHAVGELKANPFGLYDIHGNIVEWIQDSWNPSYYGQFAEQPAVNPSGPDLSGIHRVIRGGGVRNNRSHGAASVRTPLDFRSRSEDFGFRVSLTVDAARQAMMVDGSSTTKPTQLKDSNVAEQARRKRSAWDELDPADIPEAERVPSQPKELVAILGSHRQRHWGDVNCAAIRPDGKQAATGGADGIRFWDLATFQEESYLPRFTTDGIVDQSVYSLLYSKDGRFLIASHQMHGSGESISIVDVAMVPPKVVRKLKLLGDAPGSTYLHELSSSGRYLSGDDPNSRKSFIVEWRELELTPVTLLPEIQRIGFSPDEQTVCLSERADGTVRLMTFKDGKLADGAVLSALEKKNGEERPVAPLREARFTSDGRLLVVDGESAAWFWDVSGSMPKPIARFARDANTSRFSRDGRSVLVSSGNSILQWSVNKAPLKQFFNVNDGSVPPGSFPLDADHVKAMDLSQEGTQAITGHANGAVRFWDLNASKVVEKNPVDPNPASTFLRINPPIRVANGFAIRTESLNCDLFLPTGRAIQRAALVPNARLLGASVDGQQIVTEEGSQCVIRQKNASGWQPMFAINHERGAASGALDRTAKNLVFGMWGGDKKNVIECWDLSVKPIRRLWSNNNNDDVKQLQFAANDRLLVARLGMKVVIYQFNTTGLDPLLTLPFDLVWSFDVSADGRTLAVAAYGRLELWSLSAEKPERIRSLPIPAPYQAGSVSFSLDGRRLAVSHPESRDIWIHDLEAGLVSHKLRLPFDAHHVLFANDNRHLVTANSNGTIYVLRLDQPANVGSDQRSTSAPTKNNPQLSLKPTLKPAVPSSQPGAATSSPWDLLDAASIPLTEREPGQPKELVAVLGEHGKRHWGQVVPIAMRPDGKQAVSSGDDGLRFWDVPTGRQIAFDPRFPRAYWPNVTYSSDGKNLVLSRFIDQEDQIHRFPVNAEGVDLKDLPPSSGGEFDSRVRHTFSPDERYAVRWKPDWAVPQHRIGALLDLNEATPKVVKEYPGTMAAAFARDSQLLAIVQNDDQTISILDLRQTPPVEKLRLKTEATATKDRPSKGFFDVAFAPDGRLATSDNNGHTWLWDVRGEQPKLLFGLEDSGWLSFATEAPTLIVLPGEQGVRVWDVAEEAAKRRHAFDANDLDLIPIHQSNFGGMPALTPDGRGVITGHYNYAVLSWDISGPKPLLLTPNPRQPFAVGFFPEVLPDVMATIDDAFRLRLWHPTKDGLIEHAATQENPSLKYRPLNRSSDGSLLVTAPSSRIPSCVLWKWDGQQLAPQMSVGPGEATRAALSHDNRRLAIGYDRDGRIEIWDVSSTPARLDRTLKTGSPPSGWLQIAFAKDDSVLVAHKYSQVVAWDLKLPDAASAPTVIGNADNAGITVSHDGLSLVTVGTGEGAALYDLRTSPPQLMLRHPSNPGGLPNVAFSPNGKLLAVSDHLEPENYGIALYDMASGVRKLRLPMPGVFFRMSFTDDNRHLVTTNTNGTIYVLRLNKPLK